MASVTNENGRRSIQFVGEDEKRRTIRLGKCDQRCAEGVKLHIERMAESKRTGMPLHSDTATWLASIGDDLRERIARTGLITSLGAAQVKAALTISSMTDAYIERRTADMKPWSIKMLKQARGKLTGFYGGDKPVLEITVADAQDFRRSLASKHSVAYVAKIVILSRQFFKDAVDRELIAKNPFAKVKAGSQRNPQRQRFISCAVIDKAIEHAPNAEWKLIIALARYGGVRVPSEVLALRWEDVNWTQGKVLIRSSKTEHHLGKESRLIPLYPELKPYLLAAFEQAEEGAVFAVRRYRDPAVNIRTQFLRILGAAGIEPWPKLFQNLRSSRQTELTEKWPAHVVCAWMGNSEVVAREHYLQITDEHFARAAGGDGKAEAVGAEPAAEPAPEVGAKSGAESGAVPAGFVSQPLASTRSDNILTPDPATLCETTQVDASACKTTSMGAEGFEPSKAEPSDLQSDPFDHFGTRPGFWPTRRRHATAMGSMRDGRHRCNDRPTTLWLRRASYCASRKSNWKSTARLLGLLTVIWSWILASSCMVCQDSLKIDWPLASNHVT